MSNTVDNSKRRFLTTAASVVVGGAGAAAVAVPFVASMLPSAKARAAGAPIKVDISKLQPGQLIRPEWQGKPVWILRRSEEVISDLTTLDEQLLDPASAIEEQQPDYCQNPARSIREDVIVLVGICTHLGCSPIHVPKLEAESKNLGSEWKGGFTCPCHGSKFDLAGRVYKGVPAPTNLVVPPHYFIDDNLILVGEHAPKGVA